MFSFKEIPKLLTEQKSETKEASTKNRLNFFIQPSTVAINKSRNVAFKEAVIRLELHARLPANIKTTPDDIQLSLFPHGFSNSVYKATIGDTQLVARFPGNKTESFINRANEINNTRMAARLAMYPEIINADQKTGVLVTRCIENAVPLTEITLKQEANLIEGIKLLKKLHQSTEPFDNVNDVFLSINNFTKILESKTAFPQDCKEIRSQIDEIHGIISALISAKVIKKVPCHNDLTPPNFILANNKLWLIDWEFSGNNDPLYDLVFLANRLKLTDEEDKQLLKMYFGDFREEEYHRFQLYKPVIKYFGMLYTLAQIENGNTKLPLHIYTNHAKTVLKECETLLKSSLYVDALKFYSLEKQQGYARLASDDKLTADTTMKPWAK